MKTPRGKIGAPPKREPRPGERFQLGVRVTPDMKRRLEAAAEQTGRSLSQEAELRLERSFDREDLLADVLITAYGSREVAGFVVLLVDVMQAAGWHAHTHNLSIRDLLSADAGAWLFDPAAYAQARQAVDRVFQMLRPPLEINTGEPTAARKTAGLTVQSVRSAIGRTVVRERIAAIHAARERAEVRGTSYAPPALATKIAQLLGALVERINDTDTAPVAAEDPGGKTKASGASES